jgi:iron(III) transport system substrate-binding protein
VSASAEGIPDTFKDPEGHWTGFSARARVLVVNKSAESKPDSILAYADSRWKAKGVIANPLFGTTTAAAAALFTVWGDERTKAFFDDMKENNVKISTSNGENADLVASSEFNFALVDSLWGTPLPYCRIMPMPLILVRRPAGRAIDETFPSAPAV